MTDNVHHISDQRALATQQQGRLPASLQPAEPAERIKHLAACLALVRPAGMGDEAAEEWLSVAAMEVGELPQDILASSAAKARKVCTHHGQIVPRILEEAENWLAFRRARFSTPTVPLERRIAAPRWEPEPGEIERIKREAAERLKAER